MEESKNYLVDYNNDGSFISMHNSSRNSNSEEITSAHLEYKEDSFNSQNSFDYKPQGLPLCHNCHHILPNAQILRDSVNLDGVPINESSPPALQNVLKVSKENTPDESSIGTQQKLVANLIENGCSGGVSIEELVKMVVSAVKDSGVLNINGKKNNRNEEPEIILQRKRQQVIKIINFL